MLQTVITLHSEGKSNRKNHHARLWFENLNGYSVAHRAFPKRFLERLLRAIDGGKILGQDLLPLLSKSEVRTISTRVRVCDLRSLEPMGELEVACLLSVCVRPPEMLSSDFKFLLFPSGNDLLQSLCHLVRPTRLSRACPAWSGRYA